MAVNAFCRAAAAAFIEIGVGPEFVSILPVVTADLSAPLDKRTARSRHIRHRAGCGTQQGPVDHLAGSRRRMLCREGRCCTTDRTLWADEIDVAVEAFVFWNTGIHTEAERSDYGGLGYPMQ